MSYNTKSTMFDNTLLEVAAKIGRRYERDTTPSWLIHPDDSRFDAPQVSDEIDIFDAIESAIDLATKHGRHNQKNHGRRGVDTAPNVRRAKLMSEDRSDTMGLRTTAGGKVRNPDATGGYLAGIPEKVEFMGRTLTPKHSLWHHLEKGPDGALRVTEKRAELHAKIIKDALEGVPSQENPTFYMLGGGPAAGKTTAIKQGLADVPLKDERKSVHVNADEAKEAFPEFNRMKEATSDRDFFAAAAFTHEESSIMTDMIQNAAYKARKSITLDGTGDGKIESLMARVQKARDNGYKVEATYVTIPTNEAQRRAEYRALTEKRYVPEFIVRGTHAEVSRVFPEAIKRGLFDTVRLIDATERGNAKEIGRGEGTDFTVSNQALYNDFIAKGEE